MLYPILSLLPGEVLDWVDSNETKKKDIFLKNIKQDHEPIGTFLALVSSSSTFLTGSTLPLIMVSKIP